MKRVTIADVAKHAHVSNSTVSQYLNKRYEYMSDKTREKIEKAIEELNYRPNALARSLTQKSTFTIGVVVGNIVHDFSIKVLNELEKQFDARGFHMIVCNTADEPAKERKHIEALLDKQVDGLIVFPTLRNEDLFASLLKQKMPIVFIDRYLNTLPIPAVLTDNALAIELAVQAIDAFPIALVTTPITGHITPRIERVEGFKRALQKRQASVEEAYIHSVETEQMTAVFDELLRMPTPPKGIIAGNDRVLRELMKFLANKPQRIPDALQVVAIDDVVYSPFLNPPLTVVAQPAIEIADRAAELLMAQIDHYKTPTDLKLYRIEPTLIRRRSTI